LPPAAAAARWKKRRVIRTVGSGATISDATVELALSALRELQHDECTVRFGACRAWAEPDGMIVLVREDVGRPTRWTS